MENGNTFLQDDMDKEIKKIRGMETFEIMEGVKPEDTRSQKYPMTRYKEIGYHTIFNINMDGKFIRKQICT